MARSKYIYLVSHKDESVVPIACFTVKREARIWANGSQFKLEDLRLTRMVDGCDTDFIGSRVFCNWEK